MSPSNQEKTSTVYTDPQLYDRYFASGDDHNIEILFSQHLNVRVEIIDNGFRVEGRADNVRRALKAMNQISATAKGGTVINNEQIEKVLNPSARRSFKKAASAEDKAEQKRQKSKHGVKPKNELQAELLELIDHNRIIFAIGPAGTGKTFLGVAKAVQYLKSKQVRKVVLARPAVEAGESLGFLPGGLDEKLAPYLRPLYDELEAVFDSYEQVQSRMASGNIEVGSIGHLRGRTLKESFVVIDEAQNMTIKQMKMALTRIGPGTTVVLTGDPGQIDLEDKSKSGLMDAVKRLQGKPGVGVVEFPADKKFQVRDPIVQVVIDGYNEDPVETPQQRSQPQTPRR